MKSALFRVIALMVVLAMVATPVSAQPENQTISVSNGPEQDPRLKMLSDPQTEEPAFVSKTNHTGSYIVLLEDNPLATYQGDIAGIRTPSRTESGAIEVESTPAQSYLEYLNKKMDGVINSANQAIERKLVVDYRYDLILNGFATKMTKEEAAEVSMLPGVRAVYIDELWQVQTDISPEFIGATALWDGSASTELGTKGEGMLVGILDTGINMDHPSFAAVGDDGYGHENPYGTGVYKGLCASDSTNYICNDKLVGVWAYTSDSESLYGEDAEDHGSHTASTAAGNYLTSTYGDETVEISGMAPHANIIAYDVCYSEGCAYSDSAAAVQQAISDGVDVLNYSIGPSSGTVNPYDNPVEMAMLDAIEFGILTATAAGNSGPDPSTVYKSPAWSLVVANSAHGRLFDTAVAVYEEGNTEPIVLTEGQQGTGPSFGSNMVNKQIKWDPTNNLGCTEFATGTFTDSVALIQRGTCNFAVKVGNATTAGAVAVLVYNNVDEPLLIMSGLDATTIPSAFISQDSGLDIIAAMTINPNLVVDIDPNLVKPEWEDILASSSSRGPFELMDVLQPNVSAPGTNVLAAYGTPGAIPPFGGVGTDEEIKLMSGTSMAGPHGAGASLLLMDMFPDWTTQEIKSALIMTAYDDTTTKEDGLTPTDAFDDGNGRIDLTKAALVGLVMDETATNFENANPAEGGDVRTLNIPSYQNSECVGSCVFSRTVKNVADVVTEYTVNATAGGGVTITPSPASFSIDPGATLTIEFTVDVTAAAELAVWQFGSITFDTSATHSNSSPISDARFPIAVVPSGGNVPSLVEQDIMRDAGGVLLEGLRAIPISVLTIETAGLTVPVEYEFDLATDSTSHEVYDDLDETWWMTFSVPTDTKRLVMEVLDTTAVDLDLYFGSGTTPSEATELDLSATATAFEYLSVVDPEPGNYWVLVQNWSEDLPADPDSILFGLGLVPNTSAGNFSVSGPASVPGDTEFDLEVTWDIPDMAVPSVWYGWFSLGSDASNPGNVSSTELNLYRVGDDVTKEASLEEALHGDTITYTIEVAPNYGDQDLTYTLSDALPTGVTYVPDSLQTTGNLTPATYDADTNTINWTGLVPYVEFSYVASDNTTNPYCGIPVSDTGEYFDAFTNLEFLTDPDLDGDGLFWGYGSQANTGFYDEIMELPPVLTEDGYFGMDRENFEPWDYTNYPFPTAQPPDAILAPWWRDMQIVYDEANNYGVTAVNYGVAWLVEFDDIVDWYSIAYAGYGIPYVTMDMEVFVWKEVDPSFGWPDIVVAYDNVTGPWNDSYWFGGDWGSVGLENQDATIGTTYAYDDWTPQSGDIVCFDYGPLNDQPILISFDVTVDSDAPYGLITNEVLHTNDGLNTQQGSAVAEVEIVPLEPKINEFSANTTSDDVEFVEMFGSPNADYSAYTILEIEGEGAASGTVDEVISMGVTDENGIFLVNLANGDLENGTLSLLLVKDNEAEEGNDIDSDNDGTIDGIYWSEITDGVAVHDGTSTDLTYAIPVLGVNYDGLGNFAPGAASRIPDGFDTELATDWVRNDFDLAGIPGFTGTPIFGEAYNTPGAFNQIVNDPPVLGEIGDKTVDELALLTFTAEATDPNPQTLTFSLTGIVPDGAAIDPATGVFTWTPTEAQGPGEFTFSVCVSDGVDEDCEEITVTVNEVNLSPVLDPIGPQSGEEDTLITFTAKATDADLPAQTLTFSLTGTVPAGAAIDPASGVFTWTPTEAQGPGEFTFTVQVCDDAVEPLCDTEEITVTVNEVNLAPELDPIGAQSGVEGVPITFTATATDADLPAQTRTFSLTGTVPADAAIDPATGVFTWTPTVAGAYTFTVQVCDDAVEPLCDTEEITITVNAVVPDVFTIYLPLILK